MLAAEASLRAIGQALRRARTLGEHRTLRLSSLEYAKSHVNRATPEVKAKAKAAIRDEK